MSFFELTSQLKRLYAANDYSENEKIIRHWQYAEYRGSWGVVSLLSHVIFGALSGCCCGDKAVSLLTKKISLLKPAETALRIIGLSIGGMAGGAICFYYHMLLNEKKTGFSRLDA